MILHIFLVFLLAASEESLSKAENVAVALANGKQAPKGSLHWSIDNTTILTRHTRPVTPSLLIDEACEWARPAIIRCIGRIRCNFGKSKFRICHSEANSLLLEAVSARGGRLKLTDLELERRVETEQGHRDISEPLRGREREEVRACLRTHLGKAIAQNLREQRENNKIRKERQTPRRPIIYPSGGCRIEFAEVSP